MLNLLENLYESDELYDLLSEEDKWDSIVINRAKPVTIRIFRYIDGKRLCLHYFESCSPEESFYHAHSWPAAFKILQGSYKLDLGCYASVDDNTSVEVSSLILSAGSSYEMTSPLVCHKISPIEPTYTVMLNGDNYGQELIHKFVKTTVNKNLESLSKDKLKYYLDYFKFIYESHHLH
jgi:hypothetical protein